MALDIPGRVVVFDYGEVISRSQSAADRAALVAVAGCADAQFWPAYWAYRDELDHGTLSIRDYWKAVARDLHLDWDEPRIQALWTADYRSWLSINPDTFEVIADLHAGGTRVALLSNAGFDFASPFRFSPMARFFERVFISAELGMRKPYREVYEEVAEELGIVPQEMVFVDNRQENVDGAVSLGIIGHRFVDAPTLRAFLETLAVPGRTGIAD